MILTFSTGDRPTDHNLERLSHFSSLDRFDGDAEQMNDWLVEVITSIQALPKIAAVHFGREYMIGDHHFNISAKRRAEVWQSLVEKLHAQVTAAHADTGLRMNGPNGIPDVSDRPVTLGERIIALCDELKYDAWDTPEFAHTLARIERIAVGAVRSDVTSLQERTARKRILDVKEHHYWISRTIQHMRIVAGHLHHRT